MIFSGNIVIEDKAYQSPGVCVYCGVNDREFYVNTGLNADWEGHIYICNLCMEPFRKLMGWTNAEELHTLMVERDKENNALLNVYKKSKIILDLFTKKGAELLSEAAGFVEVEYNEKEPVINGPELGASVEAKSGTDPDSQGIVEDEPRVDQNKFDFDSTDSTFG